MRLELLDSVSGPRTSFTFGAQWKYPITTMPTMPTILIKVPKGAFPGDARANLVRHIVDAAAENESSGTT